MVGSAPGSGSAQVGARQGGRGGGVAGSPSVRTSSHSTSGLSSLAVVPDVLPDQSAQRLECEVFVLRFGRRRSRAESMRSPVEWAQPQVRDARATEPVQLLSAAAAEVMPTKRVAVFVFHLHADPAWVPRPQMSSFTFGHPEERYCLQDDRASTREGARALWAVRRQVLGGRCGSVRVASRSAVHVDSG